LAEIKEITIKTNKGDLAVYNELQSLDAVFITAPDPEYLEVKPSLADIAANLQTAVESLDQQHPVMLIDAGLRTLIVPIVNLDNILGLQPDEPKLKEFCLNNGIDIILVFTNDVADKSNKIRTRVFAPKFGYLEDPATGSGNSAMGYYMLKNEMWNGEPVSIEQNGEKDLFNIVKLNSKDGKVLFGGNAVVKIDGEYHL
jgi:Predicted epimerase, PhzC/PhzF homolog